MLCESAVRPWPAPSQPHLDSWAWASGWQPLTPVVPGGWHKMPSVRCLCLPGHTAEAAVAMTLALGPSGQDHHVRPQTMSGSQYLWVLSRAVATCGPCLLPSSTCPLGGSLESPAPPARGSRRGDGSVPLQAGRVPDLSLDGGGTQHDGARGELHPDGGAAVVAELIACEAG